MSARPGRAGRWLATCCVALTLVATTGRPASATAREWSFEVLGVEALDASTHRIRLRPAPPGAEFPRSCEMLVIHSFYDLTDWSRAGRNLAPRASHDRSIRHLTQALATKTIVRLSAAPQGFGTKSEETRCTVTSRALTLVPDPNGAPVIVSFYEDPRGGSRAWP